MREMQSILTDVRHVCPLVSLFITQLNSASLYKSVCAIHDAVWGEHSWGPVEHCVKSGF